MSLSLTSCCPVCSSTEHLLRCQGCKVRVYCGREHQVSDRDAHKKACNSIKKAQHTLDLKEQELRAHPGDFMTPPNLFEEGVGHFWGIHETRPYMRARYALIESLLKIKTSHAVQSALNHALDMLRLCRGDNIGVRDCIPAMFLRLGKDQACYDFIKVGDILSAYLSFPYVSRVAFRFFSHVSRINNPSSRLTIKAAPIVNIPSQNRTFS
jgi:hypothetical protein